MFGGRGCGKFYITEVNRIEDKWAKEYPKTQLTSEELEAGYGRLSKTFGFYRTLLFMEKATPFNRNELLKWSVLDFKYNHLYLSWESYTGEKLNKILSDKAKKK